MIQDDSGDSELLQKTRMAQENYKSTVFYLQLLHIMVCLVIVMVVVWYNVPPLADTVSTGDK